MFPTLSRQQTAAAFGRTSIPGSIESAQRVGEGNNLIVWAGCSSILQYFAFRVVFRAEFPSASSSRSCERFVSGVQRVS